MQDTQPAYAAPSLSTIVAYICAAMMLFFVVILCMLYRETQDLRRQTRDLAGRLHQLEIASTPAPSAIASAEHGHAPVTAPGPSASAAVKTPAAAPVSVPVSTPAAIAPKSHPALARAPEHVASRAAATNTQQPSPAADIGQDPAPALRTGDIASLRGPTPGSNSSSKATAEAAPSVPAAGAVAGKTPAPRATSGALPRQDRASPAPSASTMRGKILATNNAQMRVILSLGSSRGVQSSDRFNVYRQKRWIGEIEVVKVFADMSMCRIKSSTLGIRVEDVAKGIPGK